MTVGKAKALYSSQIKEYSVQKFILTKKKQELDKKISTTENGANKYSNEAAILNLTYDAVVKKHDEYQDYMKQLMAQWDDEFYKAATNQQADATDKYGEEYGKIMTVARRIMNGDIVPQKDEKKLMEFNIKLYQIVKNAGMMAKLCDKKKYKSLWKDEEKKKSINPAEAADSQEVTGRGPEIVSVKDTISAVSESTTGSEID